MMESVLIDKQNLMSPPSTDKVRSKVAAAFSRFGLRVRSVTVTVTDGNGPRGGIDKECKIFVKLRRMEDFSTSAKSESLSKAISLCIKRAEEQSQVELSGGRFGKVVGDPVSTPFMDEEDENE